ncbi:TetR/AcrR family transcriptional regulator [Nocardia sputorum]|uniref:TetR family transcriptional regulator n=1 Tax=Nocardia sputorum TaxID=2984338 RepID=A0ABN6U273_9NOCA|nr:TetR/AcrR family transcriptional regulator [Nocardia sputorum]BDT99367.1 TetR family transcriptional regulator [Nocardia sputorum]
MTGAADPTPRESAHDDVDPRKLRSRARLLDAATALLKTGGLEAVTVEAVTTMSKVARTTLYRHFDNAMQLRAATLERLLPPVIEAAPGGPLRQRLIDLLSRQAAVVNEAPLQVSTLAWLATGERGEPGAGPAFTSLRRRLVEQYRQPFDQLFGDPDVRAQLGDPDVTFALTQLVGPIVFARLVGLPPVTPAECARLVDDFLAARASDRDRRATELGGRVDEADPNGR